MHTSAGARGFGLIEILIIVVVVAVAGALLHQYIGSTGKTFEQFQKDRPLAGARLVADQSTVDGIQAQLRAYQAINSKWPADKAAVLAALDPAPRFQCPGNDFEYDPATGAVRLLITDAARC